MCTSGTALLRTHTAHQSARISGQDRAHSTRRTRFSFGTRPGGLAIALAAEGAVCPRCAHRGRPFCERTLLIKAPESVARTGPIRRAVLDLALVQGLGASPSR